MLSPETIRTLLPWLIGLPLIIALVLLLVGRTAQSARSIALAGTLVHLLLTVLVVESAAGPLSKRPATIYSTPKEKKDAIDFRVFSPEFVPGDRGVDQTGSEGTTVHVDSHATAWNLASFSSNGENVGAIQFFIGLDGLNIWLIALTGLMLTPVILISWNSINDGAGAFYAWLFALQAGIMGVFLAFDIVLFYVCFELTLIPLFFLIAAWGTGSSRREAARKLFLFTLAGGLITLLGIIALIASVREQTGHLAFSIPYLAEQVQRNLHLESRGAAEFWVNKQAYIFLLIAVGFAVKIPLVPLHSWLPGAYSEAPLGVTVMLAALLAKMGTFGLLRICLPLCPDGTLAAGLPVLGTFAAAGIVYGALCAYYQQSFKRLVAYSSVSHLGFCALALVAFNAEGIAGGLLHMVNHGLSTGALFLLVGFLLCRYTSGQISDFSGMWKKLPVFTFFFIVISLASIGLPGLNNFVSEMLMLAGLYDLRNSYVAGLTLAVAAASGIFLGAWYMLTMIQRVFFNELKEPPPAQLGEVHDLNSRELAIIVPLAVLCLVLGFRPQPVLDVMKKDVETLSRVADDGRRGHVLPPMHPPAPAKTTPPAKKDKGKQPSKKKSPPPKKELAPFPREAKDPAP